MGRTDLEDGMKKLDELSYEELMLTRESPQVPRLTHNISRNVTEVNESVGRRRERAGRQKRSSKGAHSQKHRFKRRLRRGEIRHRRQ
jgi:hypothetical protein